MKTLTMNCHSGSVFIDEGDEPVAVVIGSNAATAEDRAQHIISACNAHGQLVETLRAMLDDHQRMNPHHADLCEMCKATNYALAAAGAA